MNIAELAIEKAEQNQTRKIINIIQKYKSTNTTIDDAINKTIDEIIEEIEKLLK